MGNKEPKIEMIIERYKEMTPEQKRWFVEQLSLRPAAIPRKKQSPAAESNGTDASRQLNAIPKKYFFVEKL